VFLWRTWFSRDISTQGWHQIPQNASPEWLQILGLFSTEKIPQNLTIQLPEVDGFLLDVRTLEIYSMDVKMPPILGVDAFVHPGLLSSARIKTNKKKK
jgi:hypothetical protein